VETFDDKTTWSIFTEFYASTLLIELTGEVQIGFEVCTWTFIGLAEFLEFSSSFVFDRGRYFSSHMWGLGYQSVKRSSWTTIMVRKGVIQDIPVKIHFQFELEVEGQELLLNGRRQNEQPLMVSISSTRFYHATPIVINMAVVGIHGHTRIDYEMHTHPAVRHQIEVSLQLASKTSVHCQILEVDESVQLLLHLTVSKAKTEFAGGSVNAYTAVSLADLGPIYFETQNTSVFYSLVRPEGECPYLSAIQLVCKVEDGWACYACVYGPHMGFNGV
ncbi:hypothetical protein MKX03_035136, partial [Papaver bracteatum]